MTTTDPVVAVIGTGIMGRGIAQIAATAGITVLLFDQSAEAVHAALGFVTQQIARLAEKGKLSRQDSANAIARLSAVASLEQLAAADIVIEAIAEDLAMKRSLFAALETIVAPETILATNTSSLSVTSIAGGCALPGRIAGYHFFNPVPLMKVVEVIPGVRTEPATVDSLCRLADRMGHRPIRTQDSPGFLVNHVGRGLGTEGLRIVQEGIATTQQVDRLMREAGGFRMGPFQLFDLTGMDISANVMEQIYGQFHHEPRYRPSYQARRQVDAGLFGRKTGQGWYRYEDGVAQEAGDEPVQPATARPVWIEPAQLDAVDWLRGLTAAAGWPLDDRATPGDDSLCLVTPRGGADATTTAVRLGLAAARTVAVDTLTPRDRRLSAMTTTVTDPAYRAAAQHLLPGVTMIHDSPGFIVPRIVATIVNIGCDIAQQRIATPEDIDAGARLGLGYPAGPLALGDAWGPRVILKILDEMSDFYGDPRYRPSPWLKRRALLGVSLKTAEA